MTLVVQNASGTVDGANSYVDVASFQAYHTARGNDYSAYTEAQQALALVRARDYLDTRFHWKGQRLGSREQTTAWPRLSCWDRDSRYVTGIPLEVQEAQCEYALRSLAADLVADPDRDSSGAVVSSKSASVGPISESTTFAASGSFVMPKYPAADRKITMAGLCEASGSLRRS